MEERLRRLFQHRNINRSPAGGKFRVGRISQLRMNYVMQGNNTCGYVYDSTL